MKIQPNSTPTLTTSPCRNDTPTLLQHYNNGALVLLLLLPYNNATTATPQQRYYSTTTTALLQCYTATRVRQGSACSAGSRTPTASPCVDIGRKLCGRPYADHKSLRRCTSPTTPLQHHNNTTTEPVLQRYNDATTAILQRYTTASILLRNSRITISRLSAAAQQQK